MFILHAYLVFVTNARHKVFAFSHLKRMEAIMRDVCTSFGAELQQQNQPASARLGSVRFHRTSGHLGSRKPGSPHRYPSCRGRLSVVPAVLVIAICAGAGVLVFTGAMIRLGVKALGTPADRAAANQMLQATAVLLDGRFRDRTEIPYFRRPAQYGAIEGELCGLKYELFLMPWNSEDSGGLAMLEVRPRPDRPLAGNKNQQKYGWRIFFPEEVCHWPDRADPIRLADHVRQTVAAAASGEAPPASA